MALHRSYPRVIRDEQKARQPRGAIGRTFTNPIRRLIDRALIKKTSRLIKLLDVHSRLFLPFFFFLALSDWFWLVFFNGGLGGIFLPAVCRELKVDLLALDNYLSGSSFLCQVTFGPPISFAFLVKHRSLFAFLYFIFFLRHSTSHLTASST